MSSRDKYRIDEDGILRVKKLHCHSIGMYETFLPEREYEYPCMDTDGDSLYLLTVIGGWFGLHKFMTHHPLRGILYAVTCGFCGVFYICDLIAMLLGNYTDDRISFEERGTRIVQRRERYFNRPLENKRIAIAGLIVAVPITVLAVRFIYIPALAFLSGLIFGITPDAGMAEQFMNVIF